MKSSEIVNYIKRLFGIKPSILSVEEIIKNDYYDCIRYLYKGKEKPIVLGFRENVNIWLETSVAPIELNCIPHGKGHLTNCVYELETLICENGFSNDYVIKLINNVINERWIDNLQ